MTAISPQGASFSFSADVGGGFSGLALTDISVTSPEAEIIDFTPAQSLHRVYISTMDNTGGSLSVSYNRSVGSVFLDGFVGYSGYANFSSPKWSFSLPVIVSNVSESATVGDIVKGTIQFVYSRTR